MNNFTLSDNIKLETSQDVDQANNSDTDTSSLQRNHNTHSHNTRSNTHTHSTNTHSKTNTQSKKHSEIQHQKNSEKVKKKTYMEELTKSDDSDDPLLNTEDPTVDSEEEKEGCYFCCVFCVCQEKIDPELSEMYEEPCCSKLCCWSVWKRLCCCANVWYFLFCCKEWRALCCIKKKYKPVEIDDKSE